jgi:hypothetical protein
MDEALRFFKINEVWIYLLLGLGAVIYISKFMSAWRELRSATFGLERDSAQSRLNQAAAVLVLLVMMAVAEFVVVSFVTPIVPGSSPLPTPTLDLLATPTTTLQAVDAADETGLQTTPTDVVLPTVVLDEQACIPGQVAITFPTADQIINGEVEIRGSADVADFGFYKLEVAKREEPLWLTIQAGRNIVINGVLVSNWDTSRLPAGNYILQLVIVDSRGESLPPCRVPVTISAQ